MRPSFLLALVGILSLFTSACAQGADPYTTFDGGTGARKDAGSPVEKDTGAPPTDPDTGAPPTDTGSGGGGGCTVTSGKTCDLFPQCGCAAGENCNVSTTAGATKCFPAGSAGTHQKCTGTGQCDKGLQCLGGACQPLCQVDSDCPISGSTCRQVQTTNTAGTLVDVPGLRACAAPCEPTSPAAGCGASNCAILTDGNTQCIGAGSGKTKGACTSDPVACAPGYACLDPGDCLKWCRVGFASDCVGTGGTCATFTTPVIKGGTEYGVCYSGP
jgi:hypothetical protein